MKRILLSAFAVAITAAWAVPVSAADVSLSGQYRLRGEYRNNVDYNEDAGDDRAAWTQRVRLTANAKATDDTSVKITIQDTRTLGATGVLSDASTSTTITNTVDLHEAYVNISNLLEQPVTLRAGRQELAYGDERVIGSFNWSNNGRAFDGVRNSPTATRGSSAPSTGRTTAGPSMASSSFTRRTPSTWTSSLPRSPRTRLTRTPP